MLYILVNNDYQLQALRRHGIAVLGGSQGASLITVPHALSMPTETHEFQAVYRFESPFVDRKRLPSAFRRYLASARRIARILPTGPGDTLLFFTEVELLNQILVQHFHKRGARTVMLEDGGFGTYLTMALDSEPLTLRESCIQAIYRLLPGLEHSRLFKANGIVFPQLPDSAIDMIAVYHDVPQRRAVPVCRVRRSARKSCDVRPGSVMFLNECMYDHYQTDDAYLAGLRRLLKALTAGFETVLFKFHPREREAWKSRIRALLATEFPAIVLVEQPGIIEDMITSYRPSVLASYFSAALLNIEYEGIEPLYLYHLLDDLRDQPVFGLVTRILDLWGYRFVQTDYQVRSGYCSGIIDDASSGVMELQQLLAVRDGLQYTRPAPVGWQLPA